MNYGMIDYSHFTQEHFRLPVVSLPEYRPSLGLKTYIGLSKWGRIEWEGELFPEKTPEKERLTWYANTFNSIELNATHYKVPTAESIQTWAQRIKVSKFKFCPKFPNAITHKSQLRSAGRITDDFLKAIDHFGEHLGPSFIQLSDTFSPARKEDLYFYLLALPREQTFFLEVRHPEWFLNSFLQNDLYHALMDTGVGWVITDTPGIRFAAHMHLSIPKAFIRFVCQGDNKLDDYRVSQWLERIRIWKKAGLTELYFFVHAHNEEVAISFTKKVQELFKSI